MSQYEYLLIFCQALILEAIPLIHPLLLSFYSTARLSWKTVKSLRRSRRRSIHNNKQQSSSAWEDDVNKINYDSNTLHNEEVEFEILQGWTIIALHTLYVSTGLEYAVRFIIPFYFHLKMLLLIAFTIPSSLLWRSGKDYGDNNSSYSLSPLIPFCFNCIIVPGVHKVHELMDNDPRGWALYVIAVIPLLMLDFVFLPGVLLTEEERSTIRNARLVDNRKTSSEHPHHQPPPPPPTPPRRAFPPPISYATSDVSSTASYETIELMKSGDQSKEERDNLQPSSKKSTLLPTTPPREDDEAMEQNPACSNNTPTRRNIFEKGYSFTQTPLSPFLNKSGKKNSYNLSGFSPLAKSRITSSALRLRQFSRDHNMLSATRTRSKSKSEENAHHGDESLTLPNIRRRNKVSDDIFGSSSPSKPDEAMDLSDIEFDEDEPPPKPQGRRNKRRERLSFGDHFREMVTGDASIRVRDHLFDLELPSVPSPSPRSRRRGGPGTKSKKKGLELSPNITTRRRSSRLAKKK
jgi:hypothetical protein